MINTKVLEGVALVLVLLCVLDGFHRGFFMKLFSFARLVLILVLTVLLVPVLQPLISEENAARSGIAYLLAMVAALVVVYSIAYLLKRVDRIPVIKQVNHLGGAVLGGCIGVVLLWILLAVMGAFQDVSWCREISACAKNSEILCAIQRFDPMTYVLKEFDFPTLFS